MRIIQILSSLSHREVDVISSPKIARQHIRSLVSNKNQATLRSRYFVAVLGHLNLIITSICITQLPKQQQYFLICVQVSTEDERARVIREPTQRHITHQLDDKRINRLCKNPLKNYSACLWLVRWGRLHVTHRLENPKLEMKQYRLIKRAHVTISNYKDMYIIAMFTVCGFSCYKIKEGGMNLNHYFTSESYLMMSICQ